VSSTPTPTDDLTPQTVVPEPLDPAHASATLDAALGYVARGCSVIPLVPGTKRDRGIPARRHGSRGGWKALLQAH